MSGMPFNRNLGFGLYMHVAFFEILIVKINNDNDVMLSMWYLLVLQIVKLHIQLIQLERNNSSMIRKIYLCFLNLNYSSLTVILKSRRTAELLYYERSQGYIFSLIFCVWTCCPLSNNWTWINHLFPCSFNFRKVCLNLLEYGFHHYF